MPVLSVDGGEIWWEAHGDGLPLMMVAGLGGVASYWNDTLPAFTRHFRVILHDQRGTGRSSRVPVRSVGQMAADARALLDHLGVAECAWLGHSTGGAIGVDLALDHPGRITRLVINSSTTRGDAYRRRVFALRRLLHARLGAEAYAQYTTLLLYPPWFINANHDRLVAEEARAATGLGDPAVQSSRLDAILAWDRAEEFEQLRATTLVICAEDDILTPIGFSEEFAARIPGAAFIRLPTGGHAVSRTRPDLFEPAVLRFLLGEPPNDASGSPTTLTTSTHTGHAQ